MNRRLLCLLFSIAACSQAKQEASYQVPIMEEPPPPLGQSAPLSARDTAKLLSRLSPLVTPDLAPDGFGLRDGVKPPPSGLKTIESTFPAPPSTRPTRIESTSAPVAPVEPAPPVKAQPAPPPIKPEPLTLEEYYPEGEVDYVDEVSIRFSQQMTELGSDIVLTAEQLPVTLTPQPKGDWRWQDTQTLVFNPESDNGMPKATNYKVVVSSKAKSVNGVALGKAVAFSFSTPPPFANRLSPFDGSDTELSPLISVAFEQRIDPKVVIAQLKITPRVELRVATEEESGVNPGEHTSAIYLKPVSPLPKATKFTLTLPPGAYSIEGKRPSTETRRSSFWTYRPFKALSANCWYYEGPCAPSDPVGLSFNHAIDTKTFTPSMITISPAVENFTCRVPGAISCEGQFAEETKYTLTLSDKIKDIYGQNLNQSATLTFKTGKERPQPVYREQHYLMGPDKNLITLDPSAKPEFTIRSFNYKELKVEMYQASPTDFRSYSINRYHFSDLERAPAPPGKLVYTTLINLKSKEKNTESTSTIDLTPALVSGLGQIVVVVTPTDALLKRYDDELYREHVDFWVQSTRLGLDVYSDSEDALVFVQDLVTGAPTDGATVKLLPSGQEQRTGPDGIAKIELNTTGGYITQVTRGDDVAFFQTQEMQRGDVTEEMRWFVFDDRGLYRPGEEVKVKGWIRQARNGKHADLTGVSPYKLVYYKFFDARGNELQKGETTINKNGGFDLSLPTTKDMDLGSCTVELSTGLFRSISYRHSVRVEEFRRPEYEVTASASKNTLFVDEDAELTVNARYFAGGALSNAPVTWDISTSDAHYTPPNHSDFSFTQLPPSEDERDMNLPKAKDLLLEMTPGDTVKEGTEGITAANGTHTVKLKTKNPTIPRPYNISAQATVRDLNNQSWTSDTSILVHTSDRYVGLRTEKSTYIANKPIVLQTIISDLDGKLIAGQPIELSIARILTSYNRGSGKRETTRDDESSITLTSAEQAIEHAFIPKYNGTYIAIAKLKDSAGRENITSMSLWVNSYYEEDRSIDAGKLIVTTDKPEYKVGARATITITSQLFPAEGLLIVNNGGIMKYKRFSVPTSVTEVPLSIIDSFSTNASLDVLVVGAKQRRNNAASQDANLPPQPAFATGSASISVPRIARTLNVTTKTKSTEVLPGQETTISVSVKDYKGKPVPNAEVALIVVDESVLALSGYSIPDPISTFYLPASKDQQESHLRSLIELADEKALKPGEKSAKELAEELAQQEGVIGLIKGGGQGSPFASTFGRDDAVGADSDNIVGGLLGDRPGEAEGGFGLGLRGTGIGGGGTGEGTIGLGNENTIGKGGGGGNGSGIGRGGAGFGGRTAGGPEVTEGKAEINGALDKDIIRRVIRRAMPGIKFCYEQALAQNPNLGGKVKIFFVIAPNGAVSSASPTSGIQAGVDSCVARKIQQLSFPAPQGGGVVEVTYPFLFQSSGENVADTSDVEGEGAAPIKARVNLQPLALFATNRFTDKNGKVRVTFTLPDNLTRYRVTAVAADRTRFGIGESSLTATKTLLVRPSFPRFLTLSDQATVPVLLQNTGKTPLVAKIAMRTQGCEMQGPAGFIANIPPEERIELKFPIVASSIGTCKAQIVTVSGELNDAQELSLPIYTPATAEAQAIYGIVDEGAISQRIKMPELASSQYGGVTFTASSTALASLSDSVLYLYRYPYECAEQISSKLLGIIALSDVLTAFNSEELPTQKQIESFVAFDLGRLKEKQNKDGGFGFWSSENESWPFLSVHVAHTVARAKRKGYKVPAKLLKGVNKYLPTVEYLSRREYSQETRDMLFAYSLYVRRLLDDPQPAKARALIQRRGLEKLPLESVGWLLMVIYDDPASAAETAQIKALLPKKIKSTASEAHFVTEYGDDYDYLVLSSTYRTDAVLLEALIMADPQNTLIPRLVRGIRAGQRYGHWGNTQDNVFVLLALDTYFNTFEKDDPNFVVKLWFGEQYAGEQPFTGRDTTQQQLNIPMSAIAEKGGDLIISKEGAGRLYYRIGMRYAPTNFMLKSLNAGFVVERLYEGADSPDDVTRDQEGVWHIKAGARVKVTLTMKTPGRRFHVALIDPLPAGLEVQNMSLKTTRDAVDSSGWRWNWYEHDNQRDQRVEVFASYLWDGTYRYSYTALATTPGTFLAAPTKAEEMYTPETFGRSASEKVIVEPNPTQL